MKKEAGLAPYEACLTAYGSIKCASLHGGKAAASQKPKGFCFIFAEQMLH